MAEQLVAVAGLGAAPLDQHALSGAHIGAVAALLEVGEEAGQRHVERARQRLQRRQRGEVPPFSIFDSMPGESPASAASSVAVICRRWRRSLHLSADRDFEVELAVVGAFEPVA